jgi:tripartite-type tricarboxylate transporter receptor subunit TctC
MVENRPGARGVIVTSALMGGEPDGSTLYLAPHSVVTMWPHVYRKLPYDPTRDLLPVSMIATVDFALAVSPDINVNSLAEFIRWAKANPKKAMVGNLGTGSTPEFLAFLLAQDAGLQLTNVPYKGSIPGVADLIGGHLPAWIGPLGDIAPHHQRGKARVIAISGPQRSRFLPEVPTFAEAGHPRVFGVERWGVYLRAGAQPATVNAVNKAVQDALKHADFRTAIEKLSYEPRGSTPQEFDATIKREHDRWGAIVKASGFTPEE